MGANSVTGVSGPGSVPQCQCKKNAWIVNILTKNVMTRITVPLEGVVDGSNLLFTFSQPAKDLFLFKNGLLLTQGVDYTLSADLMWVTFNVSNVPTPGDVIIARIAVLLFDNLNLTDWAGL